MNNLGSMEKWVFLKTLASRKVVRTFLLPCQDQYQIESIGCNLFTAEKHRRYCNYNGWYGGSNDIEEGFITKIDNLFLSINVSYVRYQS